MIRIRLDIKSIKELIELHNRILLPPYKIDELLIKALDSYSTRSNTRKFYKTVQSNLDTILFGLPDALKDFLPKVEPLYDQALKENGETFKNEVKSIFDYEKFVANYTGYGAYALVEKINVKVCPYCNRNSIVISIAKKGRTRPKLDHWLARSIYPYLGLSLFNLIPSCHTCNSDIKGSRKFDFKNYIHPYIEGYETEYKFSIKRKKVEILHEDDFSIIMKKSENANRSICRKAVNSATAFNIQLLYNQEKEIAMSVIKDERFFTKAAIDEQLELKSKATGQPVYKDLAEYIDLCFKLKCNINEYGKETNAKFKRDIAEDLGLVFP